MTLNFTVGPVMSPRSVLDVAGKSAPYFRTREFSSLMCESQEYMKELCSAQEDAKCVYLTSSGTGAMEAVVMDVLKTHERVIVINGGSFGQRFVDMCRIHDIVVDEVKIAFGSQIQRDQLSDVITYGATALLVNMNETSSGSLYDMYMISSVCKEAGVLLIIDAISSFIADPLDMSALDADVIITGSQKALACHPGVSIVVLSKRAQQRVLSNNDKCLYLSLREALLNSERGQTPWTPAVTTLIEIHERLKHIKQQGIDRERALIAKRAKAIRSVTDELGIRLVAENPSNSVSAFWCNNHNAGDVIDTALNDYDMWLCPNGGAFANDVFRVGHIGSISDKDNERLISALRDMSDRGIL